MYNQSYKDVSLYEMDKKTLKSWRVINSDNGLEKEMN